MKRLFSITAGLAVAVLALAGLTLPASATAQFGGEGTNVAYVAAFQTALAPAGAPYVGTMHLSIHGGAIQGTYTGMSVMPDPLNDRIVPVTGTVDKEDGHVQLQIGDAIYFQGTMSADETISGTANYRGNLYEFVAERGSPGSGK